MNMIMVKNGQYRTLDIVYLVDVWLLCIRILVITEILSKKRVSVLYLNSGTEIDISVKNLRLLHKKFLALPAQAIKAQLFGVTEIEMEELTALVSSQIMNGLFCKIREIEMFRLRMYSQSQIRHGQW